MLAKLSSPTNTALSSNVQAIVKEHTEATPEEFEAAQKEVASQLSEAGVSLETLKNKPPQ